MLSWTVDLSVSDKDEVERQGNLQRETLYTQHFIYVGEQRLGVGRAVGRG